MAACLRRNEVSGRQCSHLNQNVQTLVETYRRGDKSVLPMLFQFTYLTDFYDEALLDDPDGFLSAMSTLPAKQQQAVARGIAGAVEFGIRDIDRFTRIRSLLTNIPADWPTKGVADISLKAVEAYNASLFVKYFPPRTFSSRAAGFDIAWYSNDMYQLGETPLWPVSSDNEKTYRLTHLGAFSGPKAVTLRILPDGSGQLTSTELEQSQNQQKEERTSAVTKDQVSSFITRLEQAQFWQLPTESRRLGEDGADWILEGVQDGRYHVVVRWCPGLYEHSQEDTAFAAAARLLFEFAGRALSGSC
jgi:hypothetical protein